MKIIKKIAAMAMIVAVAVTAGWNFYQNTQEVEMNELALANVEALANAETGEQFYEKTGCYAVWVNISCQGKDGGLYSYASSTPL